MSIAVSMGVGLLLLLISRVDDATQKKDSANTYRPWFREAVQGKMYESDAYVSIVDFKPCVTISAPIRQNNTIVGVLGGDLAL